MIVTLTPCPALDISYEVDHLSIGQTNRVRRVWRRAGGKGVNVSRVLHEMGMPTVAVCPVGGAFGTAFEEDLRNSGIPHVPVAVAAPTRATVAVIDDDATMFTEPGPPLTSEEWDLLLEQAFAHLPANGVLVCSGSLPAGTRPGPLFERITKEAHGRSARVIIDTSGPALIAAATAGADLLKPNHDELREAVGGDPLNGARRLCELGAGAVVLSMGVDGMVAVTREGSLRAVPPVVVAGNPTGAGDAAVAALASGFGLAWPQRLHAAVCWSAAAAASPVAGSLDRPTLTRALTAAG